MTGYDVTCDICEKRWHERDPGVTYGDGVWTCYDEAACFTRHAATQAEFEQWARDTATQLRNLETRP